MQIPSHITGRRRSPFVASLSFIIHPSSALFLFPSDRRRRRHFIIPCANSRRFRLGWLLFAGDPPFLPPPPKKVHAFVYPTHFPPSFLSFPPRVKGDSAGKKHAADNKKKLPQGPAWRRFSGKKRVFLHRGMGYEGGEGMSRGGLHSSSYTTLVRKKNKSFFLCFLSHW